MENVSWILRVCFGTVALLVVLGLESECSAACIEDSILPNIEADAIPQCGACDMPCDFPGEGDCTVSLGTRSLCCFSPTITIRKASSTIISTHSSFFSSSVVEQEVTQSFQELRTLVSTLESSRLQLEA